MYELVKPAEKSVTAEDALKLAGISLSNVVETVEGATSAYDHL